MFRVNSCELTAHPHQEMEPGTTLELTCTVNKRADKLTWFKDDNKLPNVTIDTTVDLNGAITSSSLKLSNVSRKYSGLYKCKATSNTTDITCSTTKRIHVFGKMCYLKSNLFAKVFIEIIQPIRARVIFSAGAAEPEQPLSVLSQRDSPEGVFALIAETPS